MHSQIQKVARHFGIAPTLINPVTASGFSGAGVWKITDGQGQSFSVKRHDDISPDHLAWIHRVLLHTRVCDCDFVAAVKKMENATGHLHADNAIWEISTWMPGVADFADNPTDDRLENAMRSLAKFHQSAAQVNFDFRPSPGVKTRSDGIAELPLTLHRANQSLQDAGSALASSTQSTLPAILTSVLPELQNILQDLNRIPSARLQQYAHGLKTLQPQALPLQPVIRDLWHDHLLFTGDQLTGLIDFDAMQMDSIAMDLTRCLGSIIPDDPDRWGFALTAYASVRPIQRLEMDLIDVLDPINVILSAANWLNWIAIQRRHFANADAVRNRLQQINRRLLNFTR